MLEFGCGTGRFAARLLREQLPGGATYLGLDVSPHMTGLARAAVAPWVGRARVELTDGSVQLPGPGCLLRPGRQHLRARPAQPGRWVAFVAEARRVLRPGGLLALASLAPGRTGPARLVTRLWQAMWSLNPALLGGCRPLRLGALLDRREWDLAAGFPVTDWFLSSDVLVARRR